MTNVLEFVVGAPLIIKAVMGILLLLSALFVVIFLTRAMRSMAVLTTLSTSLKALKGREEPTLESAFSINGTFSHLWREYKDTLHQQQEYGPDGGLRAVVLRSTVPASMIFTNDVIVDTPLAAEFFKHLPGIFTGVGIIGTFWGLIQGLQAFRISDDPIVVRASLEELMHHVSAAFIVSAMAILLAMIVTFVEKSLVTVLYGKVEEITARLDSFFHSGASEEYLARLAKASEETSTQSQLLKDALVTDLERILTTLTERQIEAQSAGIHGLGRQLADGVAGRLQKPGTVDNAKKEASLTADILARIEASAQKLGLAQDKADEYLDGVNRILTETHETYANALNKTLNDANSSIVENLSTATSLLRETILELEAAVEPLARRA